LYHGGEDQQRSFDSTCRKFRRFPIANSTPRHPISDITREISDFVTDALPVMHLQKNCGLANEATLRFYYGTSTVVPGRSPGGKEENAGNASAFSERLRIGIVEVILTKPVKFDNPSAGPRFAAPWPNGPRVMTSLPSCAPVVLYTSSVMLADCVVEGFA
jgi:hypothetical protein